MKPVFPSADVVWVGTKKPVSAQADDFVGARLRAGLSCRCSRAREGCESTGRSCYEFTSCRHNQDSIGYRLKLNSPRVAVSNRWRLLSQNVVKKRLRHGSNPIVRGAVPKPMAPSAGPAT